MARRRKLEMPDPADLDAAGEAPRPRGPAALPPIAQVAGSAARTPNAPETPEAQDAALWREAEGEGRVIRRVDVNLIDRDWIARDRAVIDEGEMAELTASVRASGVRLPVELAPAGGGRFGLISGLRRVMAAAAAGQTAVPAIVREAPGDLARSYAEMVEENEVRAALSPYERGRIAVIAAAQGAHADVAAAILGLFPQASHAKRSKVKAFAAIHEELGDLLRFGPAMPERLGLNVASALKAGQGGALRAALEEAAATTPEAEAAALGRALRAGAPKRSTGSARGEELAPGLRVLRLKRELRLLHDGTLPGDEAELLLLIRAWAERGRAG